LSGILRAASEEIMTAERRGKDRRIQKTQKVLREALASLIHEKRYDSIVVSDILERANVGRSTFYMHFRNKDDLLVSGMQDMLRSVPPGGLGSSAKGYERILWFSLPIFEHLEQQRRAGKARIGTRGRAIIHEHLQKVLADLIADEVAKAYDGRPRTRNAMPPDLFIQYVASTFILVLNWWVESRKPLSPRDVDDLFRSLIEPTLDARLEGLGGSRGGW
jgi:AcrR family transcriptional regulator